MDLIGSGAGVVDADREAGAAALDSLGKPWAGVAEEAEASGCGPLAAESVIPIGRPFGWPIRPVRSGLASRIDS